MTEEQAIETIKDELMGDQSIPVQLSLKSGIDEKAVARLEESIIFLTDIYKNRDYVPKVIAGTFVDLTPYFDRCLDLYSEKEQERIFDLKERIVSLGVTLFGVD